MTDPLSPQPLPPAGFWVRAGVAIVDGLVLVAAQFALTLGAGEALSGRLMGILFSLAYATVTVGAWGQSFGHMVAGVKVVRADDGGPLGYPMAFVRALVGAVTTTLLCLGYLIVPFNARKRGPHDFAAGSVVVYPEPVAAPRRWAMAGLGSALLLVPLALGFWMATSTVGRSMLHLMSGGPKLDRLEVMSKEGATKGSLGSLRAAFAVYYGDHEGAYPEKPAQAFEPSAASPKPLLDHAGPVQVKDHAPSSEFELYGGEVCAPDGSSILPGKLRDTGKWGYVADKASKCWGNVFVDCTHADSKGKPWYSY